MGRGVIILDHRYGVLINQESVDLGDCNRSQWLKLGIFN
jgi:hypothetical protein